MGLIFVNYFYRKNVSKYISNDTHPDTYKNFTLDTLLLNPPGDPRISWDLITRPGG